MVVFNKMVIARLQLNLFFIRKFIQSKCLRIKKLVRNFESSIGIFLRNFESQRGHEVSYKKKCVWGYHIFHLLLLFVTRCNCNKVGSRSVNCDAQTGQCSCFPIYSGRSCDRCLPGFYDFPSCQRCNCNPAGTVSIGGRPGDCSTNNNVSVINGDCSTKCKCN